MWPKGQRAVKGDPEELGSLVEYEGLVIKGNRRNPLCFMSVGSEERHFTLRRVQFELVEGTPRRYPAHRLLHLALSNNLIAVLAPDRHVVRIHDDAHPARDFFSNTINIYEE